MAPARGCGRRIVHLGNTGNAEGFRGCRSPQPAAADFLHSLLRWGGERSSGFSVVTLAWENDVLTQFFVPLIATLVLAEPAGRSLAADPLQQVEDDQASGLLSSDDIFNRNIAINSQRDFTHASSYKPGRFAFYAHDGDDLIAVMKNSNPVVLFGGSPFPYSRGGRSLISPRIAETCLADDWSPAVLAAICTSLGGEAVQVEEAGLSQ